MKKILHNLALILTILFLLALVFIAVTKSIHAQDKSFVPLAKSEIVCEKKIMHGKNILITKEYTALNKKMLSNFSINKYIVSDDIYYFVRVKENFDVVSLKKFFKKSRIAKIIKKL